MSTEAKAAEAIVVVKSVHAVGDAVEVAGYRGLWVVAAIDYVDSGLPTTSPLQVRSLERDDVEGFPTRFGTIPMSERNRYVWLQINDARIERARPDVVTPKVATIRRGVDNVGPWKHAVVDGRRYPEVNFSDVPYAEFVEWLKDRGCVVPLEVTVHDDRVRELNESGNAHGVSRLCDVLEFERDGLLETETAAEGSGANLRVARIYAGARLISGIAASLLVAPPRVRGLGP